MDTALVASDTKRSELPGPAEIRLMICDLVLNTNNSITIRHARLQKATVRGADQSIDSSTSAGSDRAQTPGCPDLISQLHDLLFEDDLARIHRDTICEHSLDRALLLVSKQTNADAQSVLSRTRTDTLHLEAASFASLYLAAHLSINALSNIRFLHFTTSSLQAHNTCDERVWTGNILNATPASPFRQFISHKLPKLEELIIDVGPTGDVVRDYRKHNTTADPPPMWSGIAELRDAFSDGLPGSLTLRFSDKAQSGTTADHLALFLHLIINSAEQVAAMPAEIQAALQLQTLSLVDDVFDGMPSSTLHLRLVKKWTG